MFEKKDKDQMEVTALWIAEQLEHGIQCYLFDDEFAPKNRPNTANVAGEGDTASFDFLLENAGRTFKVTITETVDDK